MAIVVSDTSPLRALAYLGRLDLLSSLFSEVYVPPAVADELRAPRRQFAPLDVAALSYIRVQSPVHRAGVSELTRILDLGESQAIVLALELDAKILLMDEASGRSEALRRGLKVTGVLGVLRDAKVVGLIPHVRPFIEILVDELGFFVAPVLKEQILRDSGE